MCFVLFQTCTFSFLGKSPLVAGANPVWACPRAPATRRIGTLGCQVVRVKNQELMRQQVQMCPCQCFQKRICKCAPNSMRNNAKKQPSTKTIQKDYDRDESGPPSRQGRDLFPPPVFPGEAEFKEQRSRHVAEERYGSRDDGGWLR